LESKYVELMSRVSVTPEMSRRVMDGVRRADASARPKVLRPARFRRYLAAAACLAVLIAAALTVPKLVGRQPAAQGGEQIASPITEYDSAAALSKAVGFEVKDLTTLPFTPSAVHYAAYDGKLAEIDYAGPDGQSAAYRRAEGDGDISGDYNAYASTTTLTTSAGTVTLRGSGGTYVLAVWTDGKYACSLSFAEGLDEAAWAKVLP